MNERYLFKAKRIDNGEWVKGYYFQSDFAAKGTCYIIDTKQNFMAAYYDQKSIFDFFVRIYEVDPSTICRCTGLKDKNGKLIWENDVVKKEFYTDYDAFSNSEEYIGIVKVSNCAWVIETIRDKCIRPIFEAMLYSEDVEHFEILGNVFDNPELLEGGE